MKALHRALRPVRLRFRLVRMVNALNWALCFLAACMLGLRIALFYVAVEYPGEIMLPVMALAALAILLAFLWPVSAQNAAAACDGGGLMQRARTALELQSDDSPMAALQREDTLKALGALDAKRALPFRECRKRIMVMSVCVFLSSLLGLFPNPQNAVIAEKQLFREDLRQQAEKIEKAADALPAADTPEQLADLKKLAKELSQSLRASQTSRDALLALNEAGDAIRKIERQQTQNAMAAASKALSAGGLEAMQHALESGDANQLRSAAENLAGGDQSALKSALSSAAAAAPSGSVLQNALQTASQAASGAAQNAALSQLAQKLSATASSASASQLSALIASAKAGLGGASSSVGKGASGTGSGTGKGSGSGNGGSGKGGQGQGAGSGAGMGTTNKDSGYQEGGAKRTGSGAGAPVNKTGTYESIYEPTRLGDGGEISQSTGKVSEGDVSQTELAPGLGTAGGAVPFAQGARSYGQAAAKAASQPGVPDDVQKMVNAYFNALIDESEG